METKIVGGYLTNARIEQLDNPTGEGVFELTWWFSPDQPTGNHPPIVKAVLFKEHLVDLRNQIQDALDKMESSRSTPSARPN